MNGAQSQQIGPMLCQKGAGPRAHLLEWVPATIMAESKANYFRADLRLWAASSELRIRRHTAQTIVNARLHVDRCGAASAFWL